ncbi:MAG: alkaline phosphatase [Clostridia bacterium]|nr:alkaline phosphatase [Clostridia bacterium]
MKKLTSLLLVLFLVLSFSTFTFASEATDDAALTAEAVTEALSDSASVQAEPQIKNVIFLIPDGGGPTLMDLADMVKKAGGFDRTKYPNATVPTEGGLNILPYLAGFHTTRSANNVVTDSAAGGTALSSGYKTKNGYVGVTPNKVPRASILEVAKLLGKAVGTCTNADWVHATPASYTAHSTSREDYINMYRQVESKEMDVVLGVGYGKVTEFHGATIDDAVARGYKIIKTPEDAASVQPGDKLWGNVSSTSVSTDIYNSANKASLAELTQAAITALSGDPDGFFLMVEASWVDSGGHNSDALQTTSEYLSFDECWRIAVEFAKGRNDTVVIGAPDHDTGGLQFPDKFTNEVELIRTGTNPTTFTWTANGGHSKINCPVWVYIPEGVEMMKGLSPVVGDTSSVRTDYIVDNTSFAPYIADLIGGDLDEASAELFVDVTTIGNYDNATEKFVFNNGDKYIFKNTDTYYKDGEAVDMHGKVAYHIADRFYVPAEMIDEEDWNHKNTGIPETMEGEGTSESPYLINSAEDLKAIIKGMTTLDYKDVYFKQVENLEFTDEAEFGLDDALTFAGIYDGNGKTITWNGTYKKAVYIFPTVSGTIANLGVVGKLTSTATAKSASIANTVTSTGKIINCYSQLDFEGAAFNGIAVKNEGEIINTYYGGTVTEASGAPLSNGGSYTSAYYVSDCGLSQIATNVFAIEPEDSEDVLASLLTSGAAKVQARTDVALIPWETIDSLPKFIETEPLVTGVRLYPKTATAHKGSTYQFDVNVDGRFEYSWAINWSMEPQSDLSGTYIDKNGLIHIDENETIKSFTVLAKSKANGAIASSSILNISADDESAFPVGSGTKADPYLIRNEADFVAFTNACIGGEKYKDKYLRQICDLDLAGYPGYGGMGSNAKFYGTYDGYGHTINVALETNNGCIFPYTWGTIMNLGSTGYVKNSHSSGGICRSLRSADGDYGPGVIVNCWSSCEVIGNYGGGIVPTNSGKVVNCVVYGDVEYGADGGSGGVISSGTNKSCYFIDPDYDTKSGSTRITEDEAKTTLYATLNANRASAASEAGVSVDDLLCWVKVDGEYPKQAVMYPYEAAAEKIEIASSGTEMFKGEGRQLGLYPYELGYDAVTWSIDSASSESTTVDEYGYVTVGADEANAEIKVKATLKSDASVSDELTITVVKELDHIAAYRAAGYEIIYITDKLGTTISDNTAPDKKVVFALKNDIKFSGNSTLNHNGGTFVITSAGGAINLGTKSISLGADLDADITFDNIAVTKTTGERSISAVGNNLTLTETFTTTTEDSQALYINASNDGGSDVSDGNTITVETPSKITIRGSGYSGNLTNGDVTYVFGKNANALLLIAGKVGKEGVQARLNGDVKVIVKDNAKLSRISVAESLSYLEGDLDIEIKDNATVTKIDLNKKISGNAYIDIKSGTVGPITVTSDMVAGKSVIKADIENATVGDIAGATYAVKYNGNLGIVEYSEDYTSVLITPTTSTNLVKLTNGDTVKEYSAKINEEFSAPIVGGTTTVEFLNTDADFYTITFVDGDTVETQTVDAGALPVAPAWTKDGYTLIWDTEITPATSSKTYTAIWEPAHVAAYRAAGYEIVYVTGSLESAVANNTASGKKVVFALVNDVKGSDADSISHNGGTIVFTSAGGAINLGTSSMVLGKDKDANIIFDNIAVNKTTGERSISAVGNNLTLTETFTTTTSDSNVLYINASNDGGNAVSDGNTITIETPSKIAIRGSGYSGNLTEGDVTYVLGKNANVSYILVAGKAGKAGAQAELKGNVKVIVKDSATLGRIAVAENNSYLEGSLDIEVMDNATVNKINLDKKVTGNVLIDIKGGTVGPITETSGMVTGKIAVNTNTDKATVGDITGADYAVNYNGNLGEVAYSADFKSITLTPVSSVDFVNVTNGDTVNEYNVNGGKEISAQISSGTTTVEFIEGEEESYTITFTDGEQTETQTVVEGTVPTAPAWTKDGYTLIWDKEIVAATESTTYTAIWEPAHIAAYRADGYEIIYVEDTDGATLKTLVKDNTSANKKVVFALTSDIALTGDLNLNHNGGTIVITSAGGNINIGTKSILLYSDKDANFIFDNIAVNKGTGKKGINGLGNNITFTETFTTTSEDSNVLYLNALADSASAESNGSTIIVETPSKIAIRASGFSGNKTNGDVNYVFGKNANASLIVAGRAGADDAQLELNGNSTVIVKDNATISKISITDQKSYLTGNLDIEIRDNATVKAIDINAEVGGNASIDIKSGTVDTITFKSGVVKGKAVVKANTDKATVGEISGASYVVNYNGDLGDVEYSEDFKSITLTPVSSVKLVKVTNGDTVNEYNANGGEEITAQISSGTTTVEFIEGEDAPIPGDFDENGVLDMADYKSLLTVFAKSEADSVQSLTHLDMDGDGAVTLYDLYLILYTVTK